MTTWPIRVAVVGKTLVWRFPKFQTVSQSIRMETRVSPTVPVLTVRTDPPPFFGTCPLPTIPQAVNCGTHVLYKYVMYVLLCCCTTGRLEPPLKWVGWWVPGFLHGPQVLYIEHCECYDRLFPSNPFCIAAHQEGGYVSSQA